MDELLQTTQTQNENAGVFRDLMRTKKIDLFAIKKVKTGVSELDKMLNGGLPFGILNVIASSEGVGKSTFVSQIMCHALEDDSNKVFLSSGEMSDELVYNTFSYQMSGRHVTDGKLGRTYVSNDIDRKIREGNMGRIYPYSMGYDVNNRYETFKKHLEYAHTQLGCNIFIIDNLMSASQEFMPDKLSEYEQQSKLGWFLSSFAANRNTCVILVAHTRKEGSFEVDNINDTISGSSKPKNCASLVIFYSKLPKKERKADPNSNQRLIKVTKNRLYGKCDYEGIRVSYDERCKRIYGEQDINTYLNDFTCLREVSYDDGGLDEYLKKYNSFN